ncbi:hypothetical protein BC829DRAFT_366816, partial [Chytridium lagenaria]
EALLQHLWHKNYYWPNMSCNARDFVANCIECQRLSISRMGFHPSSHIMACFPFDHVVADLYSINVVDRNGYAHALILTDVAKRFVILRPFNCWAAYLCCFREVLSKKRRGKINNKEKKEPRQGSHLLW